MELGPPKYLDWSGPLGSNSIKVVVSWDPLRNMPVLARQSTV